MNQPYQLNREGRQQAHRILGYLNFSSGAEDAAMLSDLNSLFAKLDNPQNNRLAHEQVCELLSYELQLAERSQENKALVDGRQARTGLNLTIQHVLPAYLAFHRDLLFHRRSESLFNSFFVGRVFEVVLKLSEWHDQPDELVPRALGRLNDFIGHRPVAVLETQKLEPYQHEWVRPIPLYIRQAGVAHGPDQKVIECAIRLLRETDPELLEIAQFDPELLDELAVDPRSFDFDHPVNKRPNHHFGQWDEHHIDNDGHYRRFVIHQVTLDALTSRIGEESELPTDQMIYEAGSVLAGTILMAAGICGYGPGAHDSTVTLSSLLPTVAYYRDRFYSDLLARLPEPHRGRLAEEASIRQQPFGAARQHLNRQLARFRAFQMVHVNLALVFSRMGYEEAAMRHANILPVASARMVCQIECLMFAGFQALEKDDLALASETLPRLFNLLKRAIDCGAIIDPWNILGFDANYGLFHGTENTVRDHRADELAQLMEQIFGFSSRVWIAAQAADRQEISQRVSENFREIVDWWHKFAVHEVSSVDSVDSEEIYAATKDVAGLINQWQKSGAQTGDVQFWANHAHSFLSARAYILAITSLIERDDYVTSMALLIHWLTQSETIPLQQNSGSFQLLVADWIARQRDQVTRQPDLDRYLETWSRIRKFCDYVEANAGEFWTVPHFGPGSDSTPEMDANGDLQTNLDDDGDDLYRAAYEDMVYRESTDDGIDGSIYDPSLHSDESFQAEMHRIVDRLEFLQALAEYWTEAALFVNQSLESLTTNQFDSDFLDQQKQKIDDWTRQAGKNCEDIHRLIRSVQAFQLPEPDGSTTSLVEYDRQRLFKETLLDQAISLNVDTSTAGHLLAALALRLQESAAPGEPVAVVEAVTEEQATEDSADQTAEIERELWIQTYSCLLASDRPGIAAYLGKLIPLLANKPLLYVPLSKGGSPLQIVATRIRQCLISQLLQNMPRLGLLVETRELLHVALMMERNQTVRQGAVTEFDEIFRIGYSSMVEALVTAFQAEENPTLAFPINQPQDSNAKGDDDAAVREKGKTSPAPDDDEESLVDWLNTLASSMLMLWLSHSQTLRLSVLEKVRETRDQREDEWDRMVHFIDLFGDRIFTQQFLNLSNIRAILHQGVEHWLEMVEREESDDFGWQVIQRIHDGYPRKDAIRNLTWVLEAVIENFNEYRDYNCTTTQSDNGKLLYVLLDFLRLRCRYDQVCWNLKPYIWAHESLIRLDENNSASKWRRLLSQRVKQEADRLLTRLKQLQDRYSIQMATVSQRLSERFVHPMQVDRLTSLVAKAMQDPQSEESQRAFEMIESYAETLTQQPIGVGFDLPGWITELQNEVDAQSENLIGTRRSGEHSLVEKTNPDLKSLLQQIRDMPRRPWGGNGGNGGNGGSSEKAGA